MATPPKVLLIGWDAADWRMVDPLIARGLMPALAGVIARGVRGNLASIEPVLSPLIWTSIATGKRPHKHGVLGFVEPDALTGGIRAVGSRTRTGKALWNILTGQGRCAHAVGWFASHPAENISGVCVSERFSLPSGLDPDNWPVSPDSILPAEKAEALAAARVHPRDITAAQVQPFLRDASQIEQSLPEEQERLAALARTLAQAGTVQGTAAWILQNEPWDFLGVYFRAIDEFAHHFMPFHPPLLPGVDVRAAHHYGGVMEAAYCFHDLMLARLLALAGDDVTVLILSDHGFESGGLRPGTRADELNTMAGWHRPFGILVAAGPGIHQGEHLYGASVLDIAPTVLHACGLPVGRDMDGKVLVAAWEEPQTIQRRDTWEDDHAAPAPGALSVNVEEERALAAQFAALGYLDLSESDAARASEAENELRFNRITSLQQAGIIPEALAEARLLAACNPGSRRFRLKLLQALILAGELTEARASLDELTALTAHCAATRRVLANLHSIAGDTTAALAELAEAESLSPPGHPDIHEHTGRVHLQQRRWRDAEDRFRRVLAIEPDSPHTLTGLAGALARQNRLPEALETILASLGLLHYQPAAHFQLGGILVKMALYPQAIQAFEAGLTMAPYNILAHRYLARLYRLAGHTELAGMHRATAARLAGRALPDD